MRAEVPLLHAWLLVFKKPFASLVSCLFGLLTTRLKSEADFANAKTSKSQAREKKLLKEYLRTVLVDVLSEHKA